MISSFAWRNLWRNKLRSAIIITAVTLGIFAGIFMIAFMNGMINDRLQSIIGLETAHIQIHKPAFLDNDQFSILIENGDSLIQKVQQDSSVEAVTKRIIINSMVASAETSLGVKITGIDPEREQQVTKLSSRIIEGKYLDELGKNPIVISERLAQKLKIGIKNKVVITVQDINQEITGAPFRVVGIYRTDNMMFDEANVYVRNSDISKLTGLKNTAAHEIAIKLRQNDETNSTTARLTTKLHDLEVKNWQELSPEAGYLTSAMDQYMVIFIIIILLALSFGIVNTMLMVIMERVRELGMLMCIGMNRARVFKMIMLETIYLSLTGGIAGIILGYLISIYLEKVGINLYFWKEAFAEIGYSAIVYPTIDAGSIISTTIMVVIAGILSALYPAYRALKLIPSEAVRST